MLQERAWGERRGRAPLREQTGVRGEEKKGAGEGSVQGCEETQTPSAGTPRPPSTDGSSEFKAECSVRETEARGGPQAPVSPSVGETTGRASSPQRAAVAAFLPQAGASWLVPARGPAGRVRGASAPVTQPAFSSRVPPGPSGCALLSAPYLMNSAPEKGLRRAV